MPLVFNIYELLENILNYLPYCDLQRSRLVNTYWNGLITTSLPIQRQLWRHPQISKDLNAHFSNTWDTLGCSIRSRPLFLQKQKALERVLFEKSVTYESWNQYEALEANFRRAMGNDGDSSEIEKPYQICRKCCNLHPEFRYSNIHPILQRLERLVCITGEGSALIANICVIGSLSGSFLITRLFNLAMFLVNLPRGWHKFQDDMFTHPICTRLIVTSGCGCYFLQGRPGVTIKEVVILLVWDCHDSLKALGEWDFIEFLEDLNVWEWLQANDRRTMHLFSKEMQKLEERDLYNANSSTHFGRRREMEIGKAYRRNKKALEALRSHFIEKLSHIIALDILKGTATKEQTSKSTLETQTRS